MNIPYYLEKGNLAWNDWESKLNSILKDHLLNKHAIIVTIEPTSTSFGYGIENTRVKCFDKDFLISKLPSITNDIISDIIEDSDFFRDLLFILYDFDNQLNSEKIANEAIKFHEKFDFLAPKPFPLANMVFTVTDGDVLIIL